MKKIAICLIFIIFIVSGILFYYLKNNKNAESQNENPKKEQSIDIEAEKTIDTINKYQEKYFNIVKRNDVLLNVGEEDTSSDSKELSALFDEVKNKIQKNNEYLKEYKRIENKYKENTGNTTFEINEFAKNKYDAFDKLLNDTYKAVKNQISKEEFECLRISQRAWLKEVENYNNVFESKEFGTIRGLIKSEYEINMRAFRALLLMLYLNNDSVKLNDYLGQWSEVSAGRIYVDIENKKDKIQVKYGGANSAYSHSETIYDCKFDNDSEYLICANAIRTDQFVSCKGISSDEDLEGFLNCVEKYPDSEKDDYKTYSNNTTKILKIKKGNKNHFIIDDEEYMSDERKTEVRNHYENMGLYFDNDSETIFYKYKK